MTEMTQYGQYGHFDDDRREFVVTDPFPPATWINYLSNRRMVAILSQTGGGTVFHGDALTGRISRYHQYRSVPVNQPGPWVYLREANGALWSPTYEPVRAELTDWKCRHGQGYTIFEASYRGMDAQLRFFVAPDDDVLLCDLRLKNHRRVAAELTVVPYLEFGFLYALEEILYYHWSKGTMKFTYDAKLNAVKYHYVHAYSPRRFPVFVSASRTPSGFECSREAFIGRRGTYATPEQMVSGKLGNHELLSGGLGISAMSFPAKIAPGKSWRLVMSVGAAETWQGADKLIRKYRSVATADKQARKNEQFYEEFHGVLQADVPNADMERFVNTWSPYNCRQTFERTRTISSIHTGMEMGGVRTRDTMQDAEAIAYLRPDWSREVLDLTLAHQHPQGCFPDEFNDRLPVKHKPHTHNRVDNAVWLVFTAHAYVAETGNHAWLRTKLPYLNGPKTTVLNHLWQGLKYIFARQDPHGLVALWHGDWNDEIRLYGDPKGGSVMASQQVVYACRLLAELARIQRQPAVERWCARVIQHLDRVLNSKDVWDGQWYRRLLSPDDSLIPLGSARRPELKLYPNSQSWAIISGTAPSPRGEMGMDAVWKHNAEPYGIRMVWPAATGTPLPPAPLLSKYPGIGENGGVFNQPCAWAIMAEALLGRGDKAFDLYRRCLPSVVCDEVGADLYRNEPYCYSSFILAPPQPEAGRAELPWLTGTAACMYLAATQYILGIRPTPQGLRIDPCIPTTWKGFRARRRYRGALYDIEVRNPNGVSQGVLTLTVNGRRVKGNVLRPATKGATVRVIAVLGTE